MNKRKLLPFFLLSSGHRASCGGVLPWALNIQHKSCCFGLCVELGQQWLLNLEHRGGLACFNDFILCVWLLKKSLLKYGFRSKGPSSLSLRAVMSITTLDFTPEFMYFKHSRENRTLYGQTPVFFFPLDAFLILPCSPPQPKERNFIPHSSYL